MKTSLLDSFLSDSITNTHGVTGGCKTPPSDPCSCPTGKAKGNNGFGNGADANLAAPGGSGATGGGKAGSVGDSRGAR